MLYIIVNWLLEHVVVEHQHVQRHPRPPPHNHSSPTNSTVRCLRCRTHSHLHPRCPPPFLSTAFRFASFDGSPSRLFQSLQRRRHLWGLSGPYACGCCGNIRWRDIDTSVCLTSMRVVWHLSRDGVDTGDAPDDSAFTQFPWATTLFGLDATDTAQSHNHPLPFFFLHQSSTVPF